MPRLIPEPRTQFTGYSGEVHVGVGEAVDSLEEALEDRSDGDIIYVGPGQWLIPGDSELTAGVDLIGTGNAAKRRIQGNSSSSDGLLLPQGGQLIQSVWIDTSNGSGGTLSSYGITIDSVSGVELRDVRLTGTAVTNLIWLGGSATPNVRMYDMVESSSTSNKGFIQDAGFSYIHGWRIEAGGSDDNAYFEINAGTMIAYDLDWSRGGFSANANLYVTSSTVEVHDSNFGSAGWGACVRVAGTNPVFRAYGCKFASGSAFLDLNVSSASATVRLFGCEINEDKISIAQGADVLIDGRYPQIMASTTDATPAVLGYGGSSGSIPRVPSGQRVRFVAEVIAQEAVAGDSMIWDVVALLENNSGTTTLIDSSVVARTDDGAPGWTLAVAADDTNDGLRVTFTGGASDTVTVRARFDKQASGAVQGPSSSTNTALAVWSGTSGDVLADSLLLYTTGTGWVGVTPSATDTDLVITPTGTGALQASSGGNTRGSQALDLQMERANATEVASGERSAILAGRANTANAQYSTVINGNGAGALAIGALAHGLGSASGDWSVALGQGYTGAQGDYGVGLGLYGYATRWGELAIAAGRFVGTGDAQQSLFTWRVQTTNATPTIMSLDGGVAGGRYLDLQTTTMAISAIVRVLAISSAGEVWSRDDVVTIKRNGAAGTTALVGSVSEGTPRADSGMSSCDFELTANTSTGRLEATVTGISATTIRWVASVHTVQANYV